MKPTKLPPVSTVEITSSKCGNCIFWLRLDPGKTPVIGATPRGDCFGAPPQVVPIINNGQLAGGMNIRPQVPADCPACGLYVGIDEEDEEDEAGAAH